jgi:hypothetical protein
MLEGGEVKDRFRKAAAGLVMATVVSLCVCAGALASGDANSSECLPATESSPGFRSYLPDCRAFELVSPAFVGGTAPRTSGYHENEPPAVSADGEHLLSLIFGGLAGTEGLEQNQTHEGAYYEFSRTPTGWTTEAITPPDSVYPRYEFAFASADFSRSLWSVQLAPAPGEELPTGVPPEDPNGDVGGMSYPNNGVLVIREPAGGGKGRFAAVGPVAAQGHEPTEIHQTAEPVGASADLSHVLVYVEATLKQLWPGDETMEGGQSLYEYVGVGNREPALVGVRNEGHLDGKPNVNDGAELISRCGTALGGSNAGGPTTNGISASGETVFFTAFACGVSPRVNEVYARVDGERTVDISEPSTGPLGDCSACVEGEPRAAVYQGASEDGSKVFFTSEQALLPGSRGDTLYEYDFDAASPHQRLLVLAPEVEGAPVISQDGGRVYFQSAALLSATANGNGEHPTLYGQNLYVYDTDDGSAGQPVFVAQQAGEERTTRDGRFLVFESPRHVAGTDDSSVIPQLFEYDAETGVIVRVSVGQSSPAGYECEATHVVEERYGCDGNATTGAYELPTSLAAREGKAWSPTNPTSALAISTAGAVEFSSANALAPLAVPGKENVYEYRAGNVYLLSPSDEAVPTPVATLRLLGIDESGRDAFFLTTDALVPQDTDTQTSWYDAREDGGFPAPATPASCTAGTCQGPLPATPVLATPGSTALTGLENLAAPVEPKPVAKPAAKPKAKPCKKGFVRKRGKCVRAARSKKANRASAKRGAKS